MTAPRWRRVPYDQLASDRLHGSLMTFSASLFLSDRCTVLAETDMGRVPRNLEVGDVGIHIPHKHRYLLCALNMTSSSRGQSTMRKFTDVKSCLVFCLVVSGGGDDGNPEFSQLSGQAVPNLIAACHGICEITK